MGGHTLIGWSTFRRVDPSGAPWRGVHGLYFLARWCRPNVAPVPSRDGCGVKRALYFIGPPELRPAGSVI